MYRPVLIGAEFDVVAVSNKAETKKIQRIIRYSLPININDAILIDNYLFKKKPLIPSEGFLLNFTSGSN